MNITPKSVFTGKGSNGEKITMFEWDFNTWAGFELLSHLSYLVVGLLLSAISSPLLLILCIANYNGRHKPLYVIGILISAYFIYDCKNGWLVVQVINFFFSEGVITFLLGINVASMILFSIFLLIGIRLNNFIEDLTPTFEGRWMVFIIFISVITVTTVVSVSASKDKGWVMTNIKTESESAKQDRLEYEKLQELGGFESKEAQDKYWADQDRRLGERP